MLDYERKIPWPKIIPMIDEIKPPIVFLKERSPEKNKYTLWLSFIMGKNERLRRRI